MSSVQSSGHSPSSYLGDYKIGKTIGQGAFSKVKLAIHNETSQKYAIKIIDKKAMFEKRNKNRLAQNARVARAQKQANNPHRAILTSDYQIVPLDYQKMIQNMAASTAAKNVKDLKPLSENKIISGLEMEVQLMMRLNHPNVVKVYQVMDSEDECLIVMDYASGGEMIEYVAKNNFLTEVEGRKYFRQLISAIDHFHLASVVHRDLKLENILLSHDKNILITDFGLGRTFEEAKDNENDVMSTFCGTPNYAAYELVSGIPYDGVKTDIWAMGVILFIMMAGNPPFKGVTVTQVYNNIRQLKYRVPRHFSSLLVDLIDKILVKEPEKRIDMEGLRRHPWVNMDYQAPPQRIIPEFGRQVDISQRVSGISFDKIYTVININNMNAPTSTVGSSSAASAAGRMIGGLNLVHHSPNPSAFQSPGSAGRLSPIKLRRTRSGSAPDEKDVGFTQLISSSCPKPPPSLPAKIRSSSLAANALLIPSSANSIPFNQTESLVDEIEEHKTPQPIQDSVTTSPTLVPKLIHQPSIEMKDLEMWHETHRPPKSIRAMQLSFRSGTTTVKDPVMMFQDIHRVLIDLKAKLPGKLEYKRVPEYYIFDCHYEGLLVGAEESIVAIGASAVPSSPIFSPISPSQSIHSPSSVDVLQEIQFELEVCKVWAWGSFHGIQSKRIKGDALIYQNIFVQILQSLHWSQ